MTIKVLFSGIGMVVTCVSFGVGVFTPLRTPAVFVIGLWLQHLGLFTQTFPELLLFGTQQSTSDEPSTDSTGKDGSVKLVSVTQ